MADFGGKVKRLPIKNARRAEKPSRCKIKVNVIRFHPLVFCRKGISLKFRPIFSPIALPPPVWASAKMSTPATTATIRKITPPETPLSSFAADFCMSDVPFALFSEIALPVCGPYSVLETTFAIISVELSTRSLLMVCVPNSSRMACGARSWL